MCQVHTGAYVSLLAPGKTDYLVYRLPGKTDYLVYRLPPKKGYHVLLLLLFSHINVYIIPGT